MKKVFSILCIGLFICLVACKKDATPQSVVLTSAKSSDIQVGEPVLFSISSNSSVATTDWSVSPNTNSFLSANGNQASVVFGTAGNYVVTCAVNGITVHKYVSVSDLVYSQSGNMTQKNILPFYSWDVINITVSKIDASIDAGLVFSAETGHSYVCTANTLATGSTVTANEIMLQYPGVSAPVGCTIGSATAKGTEKITPNGDGTFTLRIAVAGHNYTGTIQKTGNDYIIEWPNNSVVKISPLAL